MRTESIRRLEQAEHKVNPVALPPIYIPADGVSSVPDSWFKRFAGWIAQGGKILVLHRGRGRYAPENTVASNDIGNIEEQAQESPCNDGVIDEKTNSLGS